MDIIDHLFEPPSSPLLYMVTYNMHNSVFVVPKYSPSLLLMSKIDESSSSFVNGGFFSLFFLNPRGYFFWPRSMQLFSPIGPTWGMCVVLFPDFLGLQLLLRLEMTRGRLSSRTWVSLACLRII